MEGLIKYNYIHFELSDNGGAVLRYDAVMEKKNNDPYDSPNYINKTETFGPGELVKAFNRLIEIENFNILKTGGTPIPKVTVAQEASV